MTFGKEWRYGGSRNSPPRSLSRVQGAYSKERAMTNNSNYFRSAAVVAATLSLMVPITTTPARAEGPSGCHAVDLEAHFTGVFPHFAGTFSGTLQGSVDVVLGGFAAT